MAQSRPHPEQPSDRRLSVAPSDGDGDGELRQLRDVLADSGAPPELLDALDTLDEVGDLPSTPEEALAGILASWADILEPDTGRLDAELSGVEFLAMLRLGARDEADVPDLLADLVEQAAATGEPEALAMLRVLAVVGPPPVRRQATEAADRLVAAGLTDPHWVGGLGSPEPGSGFGYVDAFAAQELVVVSFDYGRERHAVAVLIDHDLGGGVKDCFLIDEISAFRSAHEEVAREQGVDFHDYEPARARAILDRALANPPCPVDPDQVEDVDTYLDLLRGRVALLPGATTSTVHQLKVTLRGSEPPIWRRLRVPSGMPLAELHEVVQLAFGWEGAHLWVFGTEVGDYGLPDPELGHRDAADATLTEVASEGDRIRYTYDLGDNWEHDILVERVEPGTAGQLCVAGGLAGPPEDCGGIQGYDELREILADPAHPEHGDRLDWLGLDSPDDFDPAAFDLDEVNRALAARA